MLEYTGIVSNVLSFSGQSGLVLHYNILKFNMILQIPTKKDARGVIESREVSSGLICATQQFLYWQSSYATFYELAFFRSSFDSREGDIVRRTRWASTKAHSFLEAPTAYRNLNFGVDSSTVRIKVHVPAFKQVIQVCAGRFFISSLLFISEFLSLPGCNLPVFDAQYQSIHHIYLRDVLSFHADCVQASCFTFDAESHTFPFVPKIMCRVVQARKVTGTRHTRSTFNDEPKSQDRSQLRSGICHEKGTAHSNEPYGYDPYEELATPTSQPVVITKEHRVSKRAIRIWSTTNPTPNWNLHKERTAYAKEPYDYRIYPTF